MSRLRFYVGSMSGSGGAPLTMRVTLQSVPRSFKLSKTYAYDQACRVASAIIAYLRRHPDAKDNLEGIALWWVNEDRDLVEQALSLLIKFGAVRKDHDLYSLVGPLRSERSRTIMERLVEELKQKVQR